VYETEQRIVQSLERDANAAKQALTTAAAEFKRLPAAIDTKNATENGDLLQKAHASFAQWIAGVQTAIAGFQDVFTEPVSGKPLNGYFSGLAGWREKREAHRKEYEEAKKRAAAHEETLRQIQGLEARLAELNETADNKSQQLDRLDGSFSRSGNRAVDKCHIDLIVQWFHSISKCFHDAHSLEKNLGKLLKYRAGLVRLEMTHTFGIVGFGTIGKLYDEVLRRFPSCLPRWRLTAVNRLAAC
jgi:DNA repair exonuclease SbcCD ATPase subunit